MSVSFTVPGVPAPQGSKVRTQWGMREDNKATRPWRAAVAWEAQALNVEPLTGPVELEVVFYFPRPKAHYRTGKNANVLRDNAPHYVASKPDCDKLVRAIGDSLTGTLLRDDAQIVAVHAWKRYGVPRAEITLRVALPLEGPGVNCAGLRTSRSESAAPNSFVGL